VFLPPLTLNFSFSSPPCKSTPFCFFLPQHTRCSASGVRSILDFCVPVYLSRFENSDGLFRLPRDLLSLSLLVEPSLPLFFQHLSPMHGVSPFFCWVFSRISQPLFFPLLPLFCPHLPSVFPIRTTTFCFVFVLDTHM